MKGIVLKAFLLLLLLGAGQRFYAHTQDFSVGKSKENQQYKTSTDHIVSVLDVTEFDLEEDYVRTDDFQESGDHQQPQNHHVALQNQWCLALDFLYASDYQYKTSPLSRSFFVGSTPLYIFQRVLRI
ncbi:hypothetical protein [Flavobacterium sp.]|uniref:hypothetical protein n=1 Tax=Flavobacterium sp. TaxID=239 RepID=UPI0026192B10|nr:hypothetical protein [Flavobacterium sp.]